MMNNIAALVWLFGFLASNDLLGFGEAVRGGKCNHYYTTTTTTTTGRRRTSQVAGDNCFSANTTVQVLNKEEQNTANTTVQVLNEEQKTAMKDLRVGDWILTGIGSGQEPIYQPVYAFAHWNPTKESEFVQISMKNNNLTLEVSPNHLVFQGWRRFPVKADSIEAGHVLQGVDNNALYEVQEVKRITRTDGVYAPLTPSGTILVDGKIKASTYVAIQSSGSDNSFLQLSNGMSIPLSHHTMAHLYTIPFRWLCLLSSELALLSSLSLCQSYKLDTQDDGMVWWVQAALKLAKYAEAQTTSVQMLLLVLFLVVFLPLYALDWVFKTVGYRRIIGLILTLAAIRVMLIARTKCGCFNKGRQTTQAEGTATTKAKTS